MYNETIVYYSKNHPNKSIMKNFDATFDEENRSCWDNISVYLKIDFGKITDWSFDWDTSIITTACASVFWESIIWMNLSKVLNLDYKYIVELIWDEISDRRKPASVFWLLNTRNAIHKYLKDWKKDDFENVLPK